MTPRNAARPDAAAPRRIEHADGRHIAMPLGGIGTGNVALCADGALRQWQLHNIGNHKGDLPGSFFALRATRIEPPLDEVRVLAAPPVDGPGTPLVTDDHVPGWQRDLLARERGVEGTTFESTYPFARIDYRDASLPVRVSLEAFTPLVPLDVARSSLPAALFTFTLTNIDDLPIHGQLGATLQNAVGHDGVSPITGTAGPGYGGNTNRVRRHGGWTAVVMENAGLPAAHPGAGQMVLCADSAAAGALPQWSEPEEFFAYLRGRAPAVDAARSRHVPYLADTMVSGPNPAEGPSPAGRTWNAGLAVPFRLAPGERVQIRYVMTWWFPNRYVNFTQFGPQHTEWGPTRFWLGNAYATAFPDAVAVAEHLGANWADLEADSRAWTDTLTSGSLTADTAERMAAQAAIIRSPSCFQTADGAFFGFEGVQGASTVMWAGDAGGSCPLNCTHVWNYEQALARLFPSLERSMRETEFDVMQAPEGYIPHRVISPTYLPQLWDVIIGGPEEPALDGMLGTVLKTYREVRQGAGEDWLRRYWPNVRRLLDHIRAKWDPDGTGVLRGIQPSTHDIDLCGVNSFMGTLWLAALRAAEEMARLTGEPDFATELRGLFERGSAAYDELLWNGEYYTQVLEPGESREFQWESGCLADQVIGQWWAHQLDLGYLLPREHVLSALRAVVRHNLRTGFKDFDHVFRVFADEDDTGLLMCTWPEGGRPAVPTRYADEVWTGIEYQVAAHCLYEGLQEEGDAILSGLWARYDGSRRNPYNKIECGDHYVRALAGWSVLDVITGQSWDATTGTLRVALPPDGGSWPVVTGTGWGTLRRSGVAVTLECASGRFDLNRLALVGPDGESAGGHAQPVVVARGEELTVEV
ncbi:GH116 family glycosyl-hydrolase [Nonomuraea sp. B10E15]|uniref:GH116 family glycosyl hydrolase n=1 Tax=Nonomuraea sp. B10E15 TaxID=3153560 RepID=UPI00325C4652